MIATMLAVCPSLIFAAMLLAASHALAATERVPLSYNPVASEIATIRRYQIEVGDVPRHVLRLYEIRRVFTHRPPVFDGVAATEMRERGTADVIDESGTQAAYVIYLLADGNQVYGRYGGTVQSSRWPDGSWHHDIRGRIDLTGGTARFAAVRGSVDVRYVLDPGAESSQGESAGEYWLER